MPGDPFDDLPDSVREALLSAGLDATNIRMAETIPKGQIARRRRDPGKTAFVLSGGGAKGSFEAGAVRYLWERQGIRPDIICGVSVGALNGVKLAEGRDSSARDLVRIWERLAAGDVRVRTEDKVLDRVTNRLTNIGAILHILWRNLGTGQHAALEVALVLRYLHSLDSMAPLRQLIADNVNPGLVRQSGIQLRIGIVNAHNGWFLNVTEPDEDWTGSMERMGRIEWEPDTRGVSTAAFTAIRDGYVMRLTDAVYISSAMPVFMDPPLVTSEDRVTDGTSEFTVLSLDFPSDFKAIIAGEGYDPNTGSGRIWPSVEDRQTIGIDPGVFHFDGGLRDIVPLRTAMRLGARDIWVITGSPNHSYSPWQLEPPVAATTDAMYSVPAIQYLVRLLGIWGTDISKNNISSVVAMNEFTGWLYRCFSLMDEDARAQILREFNQYWEIHGPALKGALGGSSWLGGSDAFHATEAVPPFYLRGREEGLSDATYAVPFHDEGCRIRYIAPEHEFIGSTDFEEGIKITRGLGMGFEAAMSPVELSYPVPEELIARHRFGP